MLATTQRGNQETDWVHLHLIDHQLMQQSRDYSCHLTKWRHWFWGRSSVQTSTLFPHCYHVHDVMATLLPLFWLGKIVTLLRLQSQRDRIFASMVGTLIMQQIRCDWPLRRLAQLWQNFPMLWQLLCGPFDKAILQCERPMFWLKNSWRKSALFVWCLEKCERDVTVSVESSQGPVLTEL